MVEPSRKFHQWESQNQPITVEDIVWFLTTNFPDSSESGSFIQLVGFDLTTPSCYFKLWKQCL